MTQENDLLLQTLFLPVALLAVDCLMRVSLGLDLMDTGADMSLLAASSFVAPVLEADLNEKVPPELPVFVFFQAVWALCLILISDSNPIARSYPAFMLYRSPLTVGIGFGALLTSAWLLSAFAARSSQTTHEPPIRPRVGG